MTRVFMIVLCATSRVAVVSRPRLFGQQPRPHGKLFPPQDLGLLEAPIATSGSGRIKSWTRSPSPTPRWWPTSAPAAAGSPSTSRTASDRRAWSTRRTCRRKCSWRSRGACSARASPTSSRSRPRQRPAASRRPPSTRCLLVDVYHEIDDRVTMLKNIAKSLKPQGRIGVVDFRLDGTGPGPAPDERVSPDVVVKDAKNAGPPADSPGTVSSVSVLSDFRESDAEDL